MTFKKYDDVSKFYKDTFDVMLRFEAQNMIMLGNAIIGNEGKRNTSDWFMAVVTDENDEIALTALMTPPHNITLFATNNSIEASAVECLVDGIVASGIEPPGVMTVSDLAEIFAKKYAVVKGIEYEVNINQRLYELTAVNDEVPILGDIRLVEEKDLPFMPYWEHGFIDDCFGGKTMPEADINRYRNIIAEQKLYILEVNGVPVTMAGVMRELVSVCGVGRVYTPPYYRGNGYASSCVASLSKLYLERGFQKCVLYTDLANPTSNSIYMKIGYKAICDSLEIGFV
jgi:hypothetical protein